MGKRPSDLVFHISSHGLDAVAGALSMNLRMKLSTLVLLGAAIGLGMNETGFAQSFTTTPTAASLPTPSLQPSLPTPAAAPSPVNISVPASVAATAQPASYTPSATPAPRTYDAETFAASLGAPPPETSDFVPASESMERVASLATTLEAPAAPRWYEIGSDKSLKAVWNHGLELESPNKDFRVHVGGQIQFDAGFFSPNHALEVSQATGGIGQAFADSVNFRRARLRVDGTMYEVIDWVAM